MFRLRPLDCRRWGGASGTEPRLLVCIYSIYLDTLAAARSGPVLTQLPAHPRSSACVPMYLHRRASTSLCQVACADWQQTRRTRGTRPESPLPTPLPPALGFSG